MEERKELDLFGKKTFIRAVFKPPMRFPYAMPDEACFFYVRSGKGRMYAADGKVDMLSNEGVVMRCGNYFNELTAIEGEEYCEAYAIHLYPDVLKMIYDREFPDFLLEVERIEPVSMEKHEASELLNSYIDSLKFYFDNPALVSEELLKLKLKELLLLLAKTDNVEVLQQLVARLFQPVELDFKRNIEEHVYSSLSLEEMGQMFNMSLSTFKREFGRHYDVPPAQYFRTRKLEKAAQLLKGSSLCISAVAYETGFADQAHFTRAFQKHFGQTPRAYRSS